MEEFLIVLKVFICPVEHKTPATVYKLRVLVVVFKTFHEQQ